MIVNYKVKGRDCSIIGVIKTLIIELASYKFKLILLSLLKIYFYKLVDNLE